MAFYLCNIYDLKLDYFCREFVVLSGTTVVAVDNYSSDLPGHLTVFKGKICEELNLPEVGNFTATLPQILL
jgi:hypothetical protein